MVHLLSTTDSSSKEDGLSFYPTRQDDVYSFPISIEADIANDGRKSAYVIKDDMSVFLIPSVLPDFFSHFYTRLIVVTGLIEVSV